MSDIIVGVNGEMVAQRNHPHVVSLIRSMKDKVTLQVATPHLLKNITTHCSPHIVNLSVAIESDSIIPVEGPSLLQAELSPKQDCP